MIRSLVIRQVFRMLDMALVVLVLGVGVFVVKLFLTPLAAVEVPEMDPAAPTDATSIIRTVGDQSAYEGLGKSGLFGSAGRWDAEAAEAPEEAPEIAEDITESTLDLKLRGTIALKPGDPFASAFIENLENRDGVRSYLLKQEVVENVTIDTILQREVILLNMRKDPPQRERLSMDDNEAGGTPSQGGPVAVTRRPSSVSGPAAGQAAPGRSTGTVQHTKVNREAIVREAIENYSTLARITPEVKTDESGNVLGLTAEGISQHPLAQKLGFQDGDVLQTINNERIDSREQLFEMFQRYQNATSFRVGILRNGQPNILVFDVE